MSKRIGIVSRNVLVDAVLPAATTTYTVIAHGFIINTILQLLDEAGFTVTNERYTCNEDAQIATGVYHINYGDDPDLGMAFAFSNSYNKVLKFRCAIGGFVKINNMTVLGSTSGAWGRKHTGTADDETAETIANQITNAETYFKQLAADKEVMKKITLTKREYAELLGRLYVDLKIISGEQISISKQEYEKPSYKYTTADNTLWTLYNHILVSLTKSHPKTWMEQQKVVHLHLMTEFELTVFDDEKPGDLNQLTIDVMTEDELSHQLHGVDNDIEVIVEKHLVDDLEDVEDESNVVQSIIPDTQSEINGSDEEVEPIDLDAEYDAILDAILKPIEEKQPITLSLTLAEAIYKYGDLLSDEQLLELKKVSHAGVPHTNTAAFTEAVDQLKVIVLADLAKEEAVKTIETPKVSPLNSLPPMPGKTILQTPVIETITTSIVKEEEEEVTEVVEEIVNAVVEEVIEEIEPTVHNEKVSSSDEFFMTKQDLDSIYDGTILEVGYVVTLMDQDVEITSITNTHYGLTILSDDIVDDVPEIEPTLRERREAIDKQIADSNANKESLDQPIIAMSMDFEIGEPQHMAPAETMLKSKSVKEDLAEQKVEEVIAIMENKVEVTSEELEIQQAIRTEIMELYDEAIDFTYKLNNNQFNVTLITGEVIVLTESYIKNK